MIVMMMRRMMMTFTGQLPVKCISKHCLVIKIFPKDPDPAPTFTVNGLNIIAQRK